MIARRGNVLVRPIRWIAPRETELSGSAPIRRVVSADSAIETAQRLIPDLWMLRLRL